MSEMDGLGAYQVRGHLQPATQQPAVEIQNITFAHPQVVGEVNRPETQQAVEGALWDRAQAVAVDVQDLQVDQGGQRGQVQSGDAVSRKV